MMDDTVTLTTSVSVRSHPPERPEIEWDDNEPDGMRVTWFDRDGNAVPEARVWGGLFLRYNVPIVLRRSDILAVQPEWDNMTQYVGDEPDATKLIVRDHAYAIEVREDINTVLRLLGWPEIVLPRGYAQAGR